MTGDGKPVRLAEEATTEGATTEGAVRPPSTDPLEVKQEGTRHGIAWCLLGILSGTILAGFCTIWAGDASIEDVKNFLPIVIAPVVGLLGAVMGFYYAERRK